MRKTYPPFFTIVRRAWLLRNLRGRTSPSLQMTLSLLSFIFIDGRQNFSYRIECSSFIHCLLRCPSAATSSSPLLKNETPEQPVGRIDVRNGIMSTNQLIVTHPCIWWPSKLYNKRELKYKTFRFSSSKREYVVFFNLLFIASMAVSSDVKHGLLYRYRSPCVKLLQTNGTLSIHNLPFPSPAPLCFSSSSKAINLFLDCVSTAFRALLAR